MPSSSYQNLLSLLTMIRDESHTHANTAYRVGSALIELLQYLNDAPYLRKDRADQTNYLLTLVAGAIIGDSGQIRLNPDGSITCSRLSVEGSAIFNELVFNHQNVLEGDTYFSDRGTIEEVSFLGTNQYRLLLRKEHDNDAVTFRPYDILCSAMNNLDSEGTYRTAWMRVNSVDIAENTVDVTLFDGEDVPGGVNFTPQSGANIVRWGNQSDTTRQQVFFISSRDGRLSYYINLTAPITTDGNYAVAIGRLPDIQPVRNLGLTGEVGIYAHNLLVEHLYTIQWAGERKYITLDKGEWTAAKAAQGEYFYHVEGNTHTRVQVSCDGLVWQTSAAVSKEIGGRPSLDSTDWVHVSGELAEVHYYATTETKDLTEGGVGMGSDPVLWSTDQGFFLTKHINGTANPYYYNPLRPYMWRKTYRYATPPILPATHYEGDVADTDFDIGEEAHIIGVYGETGVNYVVTVPAETVVIGAEETGATYTGDIHFFTDGGGVRNPFPCYSAIWVLQRDGTRRRWTQQTSVPVSGWTDVEINVTANDVAIEIYGNSSGQDMLNTYLLRKDIPVLKAVKGESGPQGNTGLSGPVSRMFENYVEAGMRYHAAEDATTTGNIRYQDYLAVSGDYGTSGWLVFRCCRSHTALVDINLEGRPAQSVRFMLGEKWEEVSVNAASAFFTHLIARDAYIKMLTGASFIITDSGGNVISGMGNRTDAKGRRYLIWSGGEDADKATCKIYADGTLDAMRGAFSGFLTNKETMVTSANVDTFVTEGINPHGGTRCLVFDMNRIGSTLAFWQPLTNDQNIPVYAVDNAERIYPSGYTDILDSQDGLDIYINLPYSMSGMTAVGTAARSSILDEFPESRNNISGLGLFRHFLTENGTSPADAAEESNIPAQALWPEGWALYPYKYYGDMSLRARQLVGNRLTIRLYGQRFNALCLSGLCTETGSMATLRNTYAIDDLVTALGVEPYQAANVLTLECREFQHRDGNNAVDYTYIGWVPRFSWLGYYDKFTMGLEDLNN